jgi:hypothetical protein
VDHDAVREQLELAATEPGGLERLMAGDTAIAQSVAGHLAGCPACTDELARLERASTLIRRVVRATAPADLRERTLAAIRTAGVPRGPAAAPLAIVGGFAPGRSVREARPAAEWTGRSALGWVAAIAAAVVLSVVATSLIVGSRVDERLAAQSETVEALQEVAIATLQVTGEPDARRVVLAGTSAGLRGDLIFSPGTSELVVVATGLTPPPVGQEYRCWVEQAGQRERVGKIFFSDDLAYWVGPAPAVQGLVSGATFGVSLVNADGSAVDTEPVLDGTL